MTRVFPSTILCPDCFRSRFTSPGLCGQCGDWGWVQARSRVPRWLARIMPMMLPSGSWLLAKDMRRFDCNCTICGQGND